MPLELVKDDKTDHALWTLSNQLDELLEGDINAINLVWLDECREKMQSLHRQRIGIPKADFTTMWNGAKNVVELPTDALETIRVRVDGELMDVAKSLEYLAEILIRKAVILQNRSAS